jgi:hypothetical protein
MYFCAVWLTVVAVAAQVDVAGFIQIKCEPGVNVFLDGAFQGTTKSDVGGLIIQDVEAGVHSVQLVKEGFDSQRKEFHINPAQVYVYEAYPFKVRTIKPIDEQEEREPEKVGLGQLVIQSVPLECQINIPTLDVEWTNKLRDEWVMPSVPSGLHPVQVRAMGRTMEYDAPVKVHRETRLLFNFVDEDVIDISALTRRSAEEEQLEKQRRRRESIIAHFMKERRKWQEDAAKMAQQRREQAFQRRLTLLLEDAMDEYRFIAGKNIRVSSVGDKYYDVRFSFNDLYDADNYELVERYAGDWDFYCKLLKGADREVVLKHFSELLAELVFLRPPDWKKEITGRDEMDRPTAVRLVNEAQRMELVMQLVQRPTGRWEIFMALEQSPEEVDGIIPSYVGDISKDSL